MIGGRAVHPHVITLADDPGWAAFYLDEPPQQPVRPLGAVIGYAADGTVLASSR